MNSNILLIEGVPGIGKSTILDSLARKHVLSSKERKIRTFLHLTQAHTYGPLAPDEDLNRLTKRTNLSHLKKITETLTQLSVAVNGEKTVKFFGLIDTLHLTHCVRPGVLSWNDVQDVDKDLAALGVKLVFLKAEPQTIWERTIELRKDNQFITHYGKKFGKNHQEIFNYFVEEQTRLLEFAEKSGLEKLYLDAENDLDENTAIAYNFWKNSPHRSF